jgi:hypothetical protein
MTLALLALSPAALLAAMVGQSVLLAAALAVLAMVELDRRPRLAGVFLALAAAIKPQAALLAPVALVAGGAFEALASAALAEVVLILASVLVFGFGRWTEWFASLPAFQAVIAATPGLIPGVITPGGAAQMLGLTGWAATLWRAVFALIGAALVWRTFARREAPAKRLAALAAGSLLVAPYAMHYDGVLLVPAAVAMAVGSVDRRDWPLRLLGLCAVCEVTNAYIGLPIVLAFAVLSALDPPSEPAPAGHDSALTPAFPPASAS